MFDVTNAGRAGWAFDAVSRFARETRVDTATDAIADLLSNLLHLARVRGLDPDVLAQNALAMMREEAAEDEEGNISAVLAAFRTLIETDC